MSKDQKRRPEKPYHENTKGGKHEKEVPKVKKRRRQNRGDKIQ
jgi:hypothetical protein